MAEVIEYRVHLLYQFRRDRGKKSSSGGIQYT